ncbi:MAG: protein kinase [Planctomycetales bacterium]|nr:protein kinase [Planctomycetales bacterium]
MSQDRNLLLGILALQLDFVSSNQLIETMNAWAVNKQSSLGQLFVQKQILSPQRLALLDALVQEHLSSHNQDVDQSLASLTPLSPAIRRDLAAIDDADVQQSLVSLQSSSPETQSTVNYSRHADSAKSRFQILRPHAAGGMGSVSIALDSELGREVAVKEIKEQAADQPDMRDRFIREAEITGNLEHPGVVPVYGLGFYKDGRPYYAMRFVKGDSLKRAVKLFHETPDRNPQQRELDFRRLLQRFVDVCQVMHYAHSRGILHRDLKPGNIMIGKYGETLVVDWGLAAVSGETTPEPRSVLPTPRSELHTLDGSLIGTPAYMSPEQASGDLDALDARSDVYGLGATLFTVLTGKPPLEGDITTILQKVRDGELRTPSSLNSQVARPLQAICLKAMSLRKEDRYANCQELADDLEAFLADLPVRAYRRAGYRFRLWAKRHRSAVRIVTAVGVLAVATVGYLIQRQLHLAEQIEQRLMVASRAAAMNDWSTADGELAAGETLAQSSWSTGHNEQISTWRERIAEIKQFEQQMTYCRLGNFAPGTERSEGTEDRLGTAPLIRLRDACRSALLLFNALDDRDWHVRLSREGLLPEQRIETLKSEMGELFVYYALAQTRQPLLGDDPNAVYASAIESLDRAIDLGAVNTGGHAMKAIFLRRMGADEQVDGAWDDALAGANRLAQGGYLDLYLIAALMDTMGLAAEPPTDFLEQALRKRPDHIRSRFLAYGLYHDAGKLPDAERHLDACIALVPNEPTLFYMRGMLRFDEGATERAYLDFSQSIAVDPNFAQGHFYCGRMRLTENDWEAARDHIEEAIKLDPDNSHYQHWQAIAEAKTGNAARSMHWVETGLARPQGIEPEGYYYLARAAALSYGLWQSQGRTDEAAQCLRICQSSFEQATRLGFHDFLRVSPGSDFDPVLSEPSFLAILNQAIRQAIDEADEAGDADDLDADTDETGAARIDLAEWRYVLGVSLEQAAEDQGEQALEHYDASLGLARSLMTDRRQLARTILLWKLVTERAARLSDHYHLDAKANNYWTLRALLPGFSASELQIERANSVIDSGRPEFGISFLESIKETEPLAAPTAYAMALVYARALAGCGELEPGDSTEAIKQRCVQGAIVALNKANEQGFFTEPENRERLTNDETLDALRDTEEFRTFLESVEQ